MRAEFIDLPPLAALPFETKSMPQRARRTTGDRLCEALLTLSEAQASLLSHKQTPWASITFSGSRHEFAFQFDGPDAVAAGERFIAALPDHEFTIPGQLVADAAIGEVTQNQLPYPRMEIGCTLLLLEDV